MDLPSEPQLRWLLEKTALLLGYGAEPVSGLVTPTAEHFPDAFDASPSSVAKILARIQTHAGLDDVTTSVNVITPEGEVEKSGCSSGACGSGGLVQTRLDRIARVDDGVYAINVASGEVRHPVVLTTTLVRAVACIFLDESGALEAIAPEEREAMTDLAAVLLGFGVLVANGGYIYAKGCGGVNVHSATTLPIEQLGVALALYAQIHGTGERTVTKHLELTQREAFSEAATWAASNARVVRMLRSDPDAIREGLYELASAGSWLARKLGFGTKKSVRASDEELAVLERELAEKRAAASAKDPAKARRLAELKALVEESLEA
jgi:hypothetical protein